MTSTLYRDDPDAAHPEGRTLRFRLTYAGKLLGARPGKTRADHKHEIRKHFHLQLKRLWANTPMLNQRECTIGDDGSVAAFSSTLVMGSNTRPYIDVMAEKHTLAPFRFVPFVTEELSLACSLEILLLRPNEPGQILQGGDIDKRLKTIFDALRKPKDMGELGGYDPDPEIESPFFCLLQDDSLISRVVVETDALLEPLCGQTDIGNNDARLFVDVRITPIKTGFSNLDFLGD